eukprot:3547257-Prymnesium_polylepis.1
MFSQVIRRFTALQLRPASRASRSCYALYSHASEACQLPYDLTPAFALVYRALYKYTYALTAVPR